MLRPIQTAIARTPAHKHKGKEMLWHITGLIIALMMTPRIVSEMIRPREGVYAGELFIWAVCWALFICRFV